MDSNKRSSCFLCSIFMILRQLTWSSHHLASWFGGSSHDLRINEHTVEAAEHIGSLSSGIPITSWTFAVMLNSMELSMDCTSSLLLNLSCQFMRFSNFVMTLHWKHCI